MSEQYTQEEQQALTKYLGECWHEYADSEPHFYVPVEDGDEHWRCKHCGNLYLFKNLQRPDFNDWRVVGRLVEKANINGATAWYIKPATYFNPDKKGKWSASYNDAIVYDYDTPQEAIVRAVLAWLKEGGE